MMKKVQHKPGYIEKVGISPFLVLLIVAMLMSRFYLFIHLPLPMNANEGASQAIAEDFPKLDYILSCDIIEESSSW